MLSVNTFIMHPATIEQANALKAFAKALKVKFEVKAEKEYDPEFVEMILKGDKDFEEGNYRIIKTEDLWK